MMWFASNGNERKSLGRMPRTSAPAAPASEVAMTWPSTDGMTRTTPGMSRIFSAAASKSLRPPLNA